MPSPSSEPPTREVLAAFGVEGPVRPLPGGQRTCWFGGGLVLKPNSSFAFQAWLANLCSSIDQVGFRIAAPVPCLTGSWTRGGWSATRWQRGVPASDGAPPRWDTVIGAGRAFHRAVAGLDAPDLSVREDMWAWADRAAWGEHAIAAGSRLSPCVARLQVGLEPLGESQLVHGDLTGNILIDGDDPDSVIIDVSPYWRPPAYAEGIVLADALCRHGATRQLLRDLAVPAAAVARGLLFRLLTTAVRSDIEPSTLNEEAQRYERAADEIGL